MHKEVFQYAHSKGIILIPATSKEDADKVFQGQYPTAEVFRNG